VVFARKIDDSLTSLVKKLDKACEEKKICSFVVLMTDDESAEDQLKKLADKTGLKKTVLAMDNVAGPPAYHIAKDADVTVLLYNKHKVEANHAFRKGEFNSQAVEAVVKDLSKISSK
jgi:hypothetical protein